MNTKNLLLATSVVMSLECICGCMTEKQPTASGLTSQMLTRRDWSSDYAESPLLGYLKFDLTFKNDCRYELRVISRDENGGREELIGTTPGAYCVDEATGRVTLTDDRPRIPLAVGQIEKSGQQLHIQFRPGAEKVTFKPKSRFFW